MKEEKKQKKTISEFIDIAGLEMLGTYLGMGILGTLIAISKNRKIRKFGEIVHDEIVSIPTALLVGYLKVQSHDKKEQTKNTENQPVTIPNNQIISKTKLAPKQKGWQETISQAQSSETSLIR